MTHKRDNSQVFNPKSRLLFTIATLLVITVAVAGMMFATSEIGSYAQPAGTGRVLSKYEIGPPTADELLELVNEERARVGVAPLAIDENVQKSAQLKADDMNDRNYFAHNLPGTEYTLTHEMAEYVNKSCLSGSENITDNTTDEDNYSLMSFTSFKNSKPHHDAMIDPKYTLTGFGIAGTKVVELFCVTK